MSSEPLPRLFFGTNLKLTSLTKVPAVPNDTGPHSAVMCLTADSGFTSYRPVYIEGRVCVLKDGVKCSFEYLCVVHHTYRQNNVGFGEGIIKKNS